MFSPMKRIPRTDLDIYEICLGGNVFGWTADRDDSFAVLDSYLDAGGNFIDSADSYSSFVPGHAGGESESMLGEWFAARPDARDRVVLATKVGKHPEFKGLAADNIRAACDASLARMGTDRIDLYYAHQDDPEVPLAETLGAFAGLIEAGKVRQIAASNYSPGRLAEALRVAEAEGLPRFVALQPHYSLVERGEFEGALQGLCRDEGLAVFPYWGLARGFLTGKYRPGRAEVDSPRAGAASKYLEQERGPTVLAALDEVATAHSVEAATVALAWLRARSTVLAPIASARNTAQLGPLVAAAELELDDAEIRRLDAASR